MSAMNDRIHSASDLSSDSDRALGSGAYKLLHRTMAVRACQHPTKDLLSIFDVEMKAHLNPYTQVALSVTRRNPSRLSATNCSESRNQSSAES